MTKAARIALVGLLIDADSDDGVRQTLDRVFGPGDSASEAVLDWKVLGTRAAAPRVDEAIDAGTYRDGDVFDAAAGSISEADRLAVEALRQCGCAVTVFSAKELGCVDADRVEDRLVELGNEVIDCLRPVAGASSVGVDCL